MTFFILGYRLFYSAVTKSSPPRSHSSVSILTSMNLLTDKVIIDATRSAHDDYQKDDGVRPISVQPYLTIMSYLYSDHLVQNTVRLRSSSAGGWDGVVEERGTVEWRSGGGSLFVFSVCCPHLLCVLTPAFERV